ncbi:MAG: DUF1295 domain-containing protein [Thermoplasmata archaeon]|nr:DUF1295 domain-containing protein [Thermoplasmata archaeon]
MKHGKNISHLIGHMAYIILYLLLITFSILLYDSANLMILLYLGYIILLSGIIILLSSVQSRKQAMKNGISKESLVENGLYAFIRHPEFLGHILIILSLVLISQHPFNILIGAILILLLYFAMCEEEERNIEKFGIAYKDYMKRVPRINLLLGFYRKRRRPDSNRRPPG